MVDAADRRGILVDWPRHARVGVPVTIATGYPDSELMVKALEIGPFAVMKKPFTGDDILAVVRVFLHAGVPS